MFNNLLNAFKVWTPKAMQSTRHECVQTTELVPESAPELAPKSAQESESAPESESVPE